MPPPGTPTVLESQAARLKVPARFASICRHDPELHKLGTLLGQLKDWLKDPHRPGKTRYLPESERPRIRAAFVQYEEFHQRLHLRAAACDAMLAAAYELFGEVPPTRSYALTAASDVVEVEPAPTLVDAASPVVAPDEPVVEPAITPIVEIERPAITPTPPVHKTPTPGLTPAKPAVGKHGNA
jgi:hypothetical protein